MKFSIIIPVYNIRQYVEKCIFSIKRQSFKDYEVIIIDDGSKDGTGDVIRKITVGDSRFKLIRTENSGQGAARNLGLKKAKGDYIVFVDGDDYIAIDMLQKVNAILNNNKFIDVVSFNSISVIGKHRIKRGKSNLGYVGEFSPQRTPGIIRVSSVAWNKVIRRKFLTDKGIFFDEDVLFEDINFTLKVMTSAQKVIFIEDYLYYYVQRKSSVTHDNRSKTFLSILSTSDKIKCYFSQRKMDWCSQEVQFVLVSTILFIFLKKINKINFESEEQYDLIKYVNKEFPDILKNKYWNKSQRNQLRLLLNGKFKEYYYIYNMRRFLKDYVKKLWLNMSI